MNIDNFVKKVEADNSVNHKKFRIVKKQPVDNYKIESAEKKLNINFPKTLKEILRKWGYWIFLNTELIPLHRIRILDQNYGPLEGLIPFARIPGGEILAFKKNDNGDLNLVQYHPRTLGFSKVCDSFDEWLELCYEFIKVFNEPEKVNKHKFREVHEEIKESAKHWRSKYPTKVIHILKPYFGIYINNFPAIVLIIYIVGFLIFTSHLLSYGITDFNLINFNFLKAGIVFSALILPSIVISFTSLSRAIDDYMSRFGLFILVSVNSIFYVTIINSIIGVLYFALTSKPFEIRFFPLIMSIAGILFFFFLTLILNDVRKVPFKLILIVTIIAIVYQYFLLKNFNESYMYLSLFIVILNYFLANDMILLIQEKFQGIVALLSPSIFLILAFVIFGFFFYKIIPSNVGGGMPISRKIIIDKMKVDKTTIDKYFSSLVDTSRSTQEIIYESNNMYYIKVMEEKTIGINKEFIIGEINFPFKFPKESVNQK